VCARPQLTQHATSLAAVESTIERRASIPRQEDLSPTLLRLTVGIEAGRQPLDRSGSSAAQRAGSLVMSAEPSRGILAPPAHS
jgi:hypothetical protein